MQRSQKQRAVVMVVDDDEGFRNSLAQVFNSHYQLVTCASGQEALDRLTSDVTVVLLDIKMEGMDGLEVCRRLKQMNPDLPIIFMTGYPGEYEALDIQQTLNPFCYIVKGSPPAVFRENVERAVDHYQRIRRALTERARLRQERQGITFDDLVGQNSAFRHALEMALEVAQQDCPVLIEGETGTGKELVAQAIHNASARRDGPLVALHCGGVADTLIEDELFGHERGAFTDAEMQRLGRFEQADAGTLFLDEIGTASAGFQTRLLRVLQDGRFTRIGGAREVEVDVRVVAATNQNLAQALSDGSFRHDLYYRLNVFPLTLPPLRERKEDIALLARHFAQQVSRKIGRSVADISATALNILEHYNWPGNVRELHNVVERAVILCHEKCIEPEHLQLNIPPHLADEGFAAGLTLAEAEKRYIFKTLRAYEGNRSKTSETLDISRRTLQEKLKAYGEPDE